MITTFKTGDAVKVATNSTFTGYIGQTGRVVAVFEVVSPYSGAVSQSAMVSMPNGRTIHDNSSFFTPEVQQ